MMSNPNTIIDRDKYIGGSDLPNILGLNIKYAKTPFNFAKEKIGIIPNSFKGNEYTKYGTIMEPIIRDYINNLYNVNYIEDTVIDNKRGYRGNTDGIDKTADIPILEIKTFGKELDIDYYTPQCQFYMETFNQDACLLVGYKRPNNFYKGIDYELENDDSYFNFEFNPENIETHIIYRDKKLWEQIENSISNFIEALVYLKKNPDITETEFNNIFYGYELVELTNKVLSLEKSLLQYKNIEKEYKQLKDKLYTLFDEQGIINCDFENVKITKVNPTTYETISIDTIGLQKDYKEIYDKYKVVKTVNKKGYVLITKKEEKNNE